MGKWFKPGCGDGHAFGESRLTLRLIVSMPGSLRIYARSTSWILGSGFATDGSSPTCESSACCSDETVGSSLLGDCDDCWPVPKERSARIFA